MRTKHFLALASVGLVASAVAGGCSSDVDETGGGGSGGTGTGTTSTTTTTITTGTTTTTTGGGGSGGGSAEDNNDSCAEAIVYEDEVDGDGYVYGAIQVDGDADYVKVTLAEGEFFILEATVPDLDEQAEDYDYAEWLDVVQSLYSEDGSTMLATIDDAYPRYDTNSSLVIRAPADGTYCIKIEDWGSWAGETRTGLLNVDWQFALMVPSENAGTVLDTEPNNSATETTEMTFAEGTDPNNKFAWIWGGLDAEADVDVYEFALPAGSTGISIQDFTPRFGAGQTGADWQNGNGSTLEMGLVNLTNADGTTIIAQLDASRGAEEIFAPIASGETYLLWVPRKASTTAGSNDFYDLTVWLRAAANMPEAETEVNVGDNDTSTDAETPTDQGTTYPQYYVMGSIGTDDTDVWQFPAAAGDNVALSCKAARLGSGLTGVDFSILGIDGSSVLQHEVETEDADVFWYTTTTSNEDISMPGVDIAASGNYYLAIEAGGQKADVTSSTYRCIVTVLTPE